MGLSKSVYNNKLRAAKRCIFDALQRAGISTADVKHKYLMAEYFNLNDIQKPVEARWQDFIIQLYESKELPGIILKGQKSQVILPKVKEYKKKRTTRKEADQRRNDYLEYINSKEWRTFRKSALEHFGNRCALCDAEGTMDLHHKTYKNFKKETFADVIPLCRPCHKRHHKR